MNYGIVKIAQHFSAGKSGDKRKKVPQGRKNSSAVPCGTVLILRSKAPVLKHWAIFRAIFAKSA